MYCESQGGSVLDYIDEIIRTGYNQIWMIELYRFSKTHFVVKTFFLKMFNLLESEGSDVSRYQSLPSFCLSFFRQNFKQNSRKSHFDETVVF